MTAGTTYDIQAIFAPILPPPGVTNIPTNMATAAIVVVLAGAGGTTSPAPGTYALADATSLQLQAMPDSGWVFSHWVIAGPNLSHGGYPYTAKPTDNPYTVDHGYGNTIQLPTSLHSRRHHRTNTNNTRILNYCSNRNSSSTCSSCFRRARYEKQNKVNPFSYKIKPIPFFIFFILMLIPFS